MTTETQAEQVVETAAQRSARKATERKQAAEREATQRAAELTQRRDAMPGVLFNLMVKAEELRKAGADVNVQFHAAMPESLAYNREHAGLPGVLFTFYHRASVSMPFAEDFNDEVGLTVHADTWEVEMVERKMAEMQELADEKSKRKALADEAKKLLTPDQLAALREFS